MRQLHGVRDWEVRLNGRSECFTHGQLIHWNGHDSASGRDVFRDKSLLLLLSRRRVPRVLSGLIVVNQTSGRGWAGARFHRAASGGSLRTGFCFVESARRRR